MQLSVQTLEEGGDNARTFLAPLTLSGVKSVVQKLRRLVT